MSTVVEELIIKLGIESDEKKIKSVFDSLEDLAKVGAVIVGAFTAVAAATFSMVQAVATTADNAAAAAERLNITTQSLQSLEHAALMSDTSAEALANGLKFLGKNAAEAGQGSKEMVEEFARAGVRVKDLNGKIKPVDALLAELADSFQNKIPKGAEQTNAAMKLFGRAGAELIPLLNKGSKGIAELQVRARELGIVMDDGLIAAGAKFDDQMKELQASFVGLRNTIAGPFVEAFGNVIARLTQFIQANRKLIATKLAGFFKLVAAAANLFIDALEWLFANKGRVDGLLFTMTAGILGAAAAFVFLKGAAIASALATAATWMLALAPFILIGAFLALIVDDLWTFVKGGDSMLGRLIKWTESIDPNDNAITKTLKLWLSLLFDFTDPKKWQAVKDNFTNMFKVGGKSKSATADIDLLTGRPRGDNSGKNPASALWDWLNSGGPVDIGGGRKEDTSSGNPFGKAWNWLNSDKLNDIGGRPSVDPSPTNNVQVSAPITIVVPPGTPETAVRDYVKEAVEGHFNTKLQEAGAVVGKGG